MLANKESFFCINLQQQNRFKPLKRTHDTG